MNTAEILKTQKLNLNELKQMSDINHQAFARTIWDDPQKAITIHEFWVKFSHDKSPEVKHIAELEMRRIEAIILAMTTTNAKFYGTNALAYVDTVGVTVESVDDATIEEILPEKEVIVDAKTDIIDKEKGGKTVSLFNGKDMGDKPDQQDVSKAAKQLLAEDREEDAIALAKQYLGTGNYTPKKPGAKTQEWTDKAITSWVKSLKVGLSKSILKDAEATQQPKVESSNAEEMFGITRATLEAEKTAFKDFAERYVRLATNGSKDAVAAEDLSKLFFEYREYNDAQIQVWKETVVKNDKSSVLDHFAVLGTIGTDDNKLIISDVTYEDLNAKVYDMMQEIQITKPQLGDSKTLQEYMVEEVSRKLYDELIDTSFTSESGAVYEMYTKLHYIDFIEKIVGVNFTTLDSQVTTNKKVGQETGEASSSENAIESNMEDDQKAAMKRLREKSKLGNNIRGITQTIISNGGIVDDIVDNPAYVGFFGKEHGFTTREALEKHIKENFNTWKEEYLNSRTSFPMDEFHRTIDISYFSEVQFKDMVEQAKEYMVKPDGKILDLVRKKTKENPTELVTVLPTVQDLEDYILKIYKTNKNAESVKEIQTEASKKGTESVSTEETKTEESSGEATKSVVESSSNVIVKVTHIENICNKAIKKGGDLAFIMKDRKISELIEKGGTITGPEKDVSVSYNISAESFDQLQADLQEIFDRMIAKRTPKKTIVEKIKQITFPSKDEDSKEEKAEEENTQESESTEVETSSISSLNDIKPAGLKLIEEGGSKEDLLKWGQNNLLNRQMKEQAEEKDMFKTAEIVNQFMKSMFSDFFKEETSAETIENKKTVDDLKTFIIATSKKEDATYIRVCKSAKDFLIKNTIEIKKGDSSMFKLVRENAVELYQAHLDKQSTNRKESEEKVFVPEKISETIPTVWDKVKDFKTLGEIYAISLELCDAGDWRQALNITTELIKGKNIETTEEWTDDMITDWFNKNVLKKETVKSTEAVVEEIEDLDKNFKALKYANGGKSWRNAMIQILSDNEDTPELRKKIVSVIRGCTANYGRRMAKAKEDVIQGKINVAKALVKKA
jgi:hypothetical protein